MNVMLMFCLQVGGGGGVSCYVHNEDQVIVDIFFDLSTDFNSVTNISLLIDNSHIGHQFITIHGILI